MVPVVGTVIVAVRALDAVGLTEPYLHIVNELLGGHRENFGTELTAAPETVAEYGGRVTQTANANGSISQGGVPPPVDGVVTGGECPLRNPRGVEPEDGC